MSDLIELFASVDHLALEQMMMPCIVDVDAA